MSRRELAFCLAGLATGTLIGYYAGINWGHISHHMHHMKAIICHRYISIEVLHITEVVDIRIFLFSSLLYIFYI